MRRGVLVGGLVLTLLVASHAARAWAAAPAEKKAEDAAVEKAREQIRDELAKPKPDLEEIEKPLAELLKKAREQEAAAPLPSETSSMDELKHGMDAAVVAGKYDLADYYLSRIRLMQEKPNPFGGWLDLTIWTIVVFLLLLFVLGKFAWGPMLQGLQKREQDIKAAVEDARAAREEATRLREEVQAERAKIEQTRRDTIQKAETDAQRRADEIVAKAKAEVQAERTRGLRDLETARDQALQELYEKTVNLAALVSSKAMRRQMTPDDHRRFVDEALADIRQAENGQRTSASA